MSKEDPCWCADAIGRMTQSDEMLRRVPEDGRSSTEQREREEDDEYSEGLKDRIEIYIANSMVCSFLHKEDLVLESVLSRHSLKMWRKLKDDWLTELPFQPPTNLVDFHLASKKFRTIQAIGGLAPDFSQPSSYHLGEEEEEEAMADSISNVSGLLKASMDPAENKRGQSTTIRFF